MSRIVLRIEDTSDGAVKVIPVWHPEIVEIEGATPAQLMALEVMTYLNKKHGDVDD
jgi:hypothetical protein|tara:strand:+ start:6855 stop:7022 length:168 start_codon:yes stop_codon:yes gene_type:complete